MDIQKAIQDKAVEKALNKIDLDGIVKKVMPTIKVQIEKEIIRQAKSMEWTDFVYEVFQSNKVIEALSERIAKALK